MDFAHFRTGARRQPVHFGGLARLFARGQPPSFFARPGFLSCLLSRALGFTRAGAVRLLFLLARAGGGAGCFAHPRRSALQIAIETAFGFSAVLAMPAPAAAFTALRFQIEVQFGLGILDMRRAAAPRCVIRFARRIAPRIVAVLALVVTRVGAAVIVLIVFGLDDVVEPLADRHAGLARGAASGFARFWTEASQVPRSARFHCAPKSHREEWPNL
jgi:hypothetical protein